MVEWQYGHLHLRLDYVHESTYASEEAGERELVADLAHGVYFDFEHKLVHLGKRSLLPKLQHMHRIDR